MKRILAGVAVALALTLTLSPSAAQARVTTVICPVRVAINDVVAKFPVTFGTTVRVGGNYYGALWLNYPQGGPSFIGEGFARHNPVTIGPDDENAGVYTPDLMSKLGPTVAYIQDYSGETNHCTIDFRLQSLFRSPAVVLSSESGKVRFSGQLQYYNSNVMAPMAGQWVYLQRLVGDRWVNAGRAKTNAHGRFGAWSGSSYPQGSFFRIYKLRGRTVFDVGTRTFAR